MSWIFQALDSKAGLIPEVRETVRAASTDGPAAVNLAETQTPIRVLPVRISESSPMLPFDGTRPRAGEQYRALRTNLLQHPDAPRVLVVSSSGPGDGKTLSAVNTAGALAMKGETTVLLVDADLRKPSVAKVLGLPKDRGLADVLNGDAKLEEAIIRLEQFPNLYVLPGGKARRNPAEMLDSPRWHHLVALAKNSFRFVIIDTPPVAAVTDYDLVQAIADGVIFVVRPDHSDRNLCLGALQKVNAAGNLVGVLINCAEDWFLFRRYGRYYYPYYPYHYPYPYPKDSARQGPG